MLSLLLSLSPEDLASELFNIVNNVPYLPSALKELLSNCKTKVRPLTQSSYGLTQKREPPPKNYSSYGTGELRSQNATSSNCL